MKKLKIGFGEGGFQGFMARHVEKCVLVTVILLMAWFIYSGAGKSDVKITREDLKKNAATAETKISTSSFDQVALERTPRTRPLDEILAQKNKIDSRAYAYTSWDMPLVPRLMPRLDPKIIAAEKVIATPFYGPLVLALPEDEDAKAPPDRLAKYKVILGGGGGYPGEDVEEGEDDDKKPKRRPKKDESTSPSSSIGPPPGMSGSGSSSGSGKSKGKKGDDPYASPSSPSGFNFSMGGGATGRTISPEATLGVKANMNSVVEPSYAMVITAYVPYTKQWDAYREAFKDAPGGQDPTRDIPKYLAVWVDRLDVTDDPSIDPAKVDPKAWVPLAQSGAEAKKLAALEGQYGATINELADPEAIDPKLTHPVPPFLLTDLRSVLLHPDVERASNVIPTFEEESSEEFIDTGEGVIMEDDEEGSSGRGTFGGGMSRGSGGMSRGSGGMGGGSGGMKGGSFMPNRPSGRMGGSGGFGGGSGGSGGYNPYSGSGGRSRMSGGMGSGFSGGGAINFETYRPVAKKLVRFADFTAEPGHKYRYRVRVVLEDPNHPKDPDMEPEPTALDESVRERIKTKVEPVEEKSGQRRYFVWSEPSAPSEVVSLPSPERFYAGETIPGATIPIGGATVSISEPQAKVLAVTWDPALGAFAPAEQTVHRASVLNAKTDVEVIHPVLGDLRKVEGYELKTDGVVLDILGGEKVPGAEKEIVRSPGETLIMDAEGNLVVTDESRDVEGYRKYIFPEPKKEEPKDKGKSDDSGASLGPMPGGGSLGPAPGSGSGSGSGKGQAYPSGKGSKMPKGAKPGR